MGVDLHVYTPREDIVTAEELGRQLRSEGWDVRFALDQGKPVLEPAPEGPLTGLLDVIGWPIYSDKGVLVAEAIDHRDLKSLQRLYDEGIAGTCGYSVEHPFNFEEDFEDEEADDEEDEDQEPIEEWCLEALRRAKTKYSLRVRVWSSNQSYRFLSIVWQAVGQLRGGVLFDPQSGEFRHVESAP